MKHIGDEHGETGAPGTGGREEGLRPRVRGDVVIVPLDPDFDIDSVFQAEPNPVDAVTTAAADSLIRVEPPPTHTVSDPAGVLLRPAAAPVAAPPPAVAPAAAPPPAADNLVRFEPELLAHDRAKAAAVSVADLIENHVRLEWHEAVAIAQHLCHVMARDPAANLHRSLVEPWNVELTNEGEVQVLPGGSSSDPLVKQVGRVLRALLQDSVAPTELRLVASQASFDVPVYAGVDELSAALRYFERPGDSGAIRAAFNRGLEAKLQGVQAPAPGAVRAASVVKPPAVDQKELPKRPPSASPVRLRVAKRVPSRLLAAAGGAAAAVILIAAAVAISRFVGEPDAAPVPETRVALAPEPVRRPIEAPPGTPAEKPPIEPMPSPPPVVRSDPRPITSAGTAVAPAVPGRPSRLPDASQGVSRRATPEPRITTPVPGPGNSNDANERQAAPLPATARAEEAAMFFDAMVLRNPLYHPDAARLSPEALSAFRNSKRAILPAMVRRHYQDGRAALDAGDYSLAITEGERARALLKDLDDLDISVEAGDVIADLRTLLTLASAARTAEEEKIYTSEDSGVTPPRPLGRQLSAAAMSRISLRPTGHLEILVGRSGRVEAVKLDTPMNGYHDRMLVSAVKAWHYKPAVKNGKPVRFSLMVTIRLPDL